MTITAKSVLKQVTDQLTDKTSVTWKIGELARYFNAGQREVVNIRPEAMSVNTVLPLVAGARQTIPSDGLMLLDVIRNAGGTWRAVTACDRRRLEAADPSWAGSTPSAEIIHYMYNVKDPDVFYVYPPAVGPAASLDIVFSQYPAAIPEPPDGQTIDAITGNLALPDVYSAAIVDYVLYRAYEKNNGVANNSQRALVHLAAFRSSIAASEASAAPAAAAMPGAA